ncbi:hypothetical protein Q669_29430 [Labrenzia sp. C1B10]|uniref:phage tail tube protein n=1 Tax=unclassified Labrenzia TaxID=2648686 RepID=UPI0003B83983|nr:MULTISPECIES: hypothetical protein [unclassified Labrenzia]ERP95693.1 hypothetical protein Q669_29430 [Labrenzia sp. C1B10]ERS05759.1 hypothetical protein Q675_28995 [Labrenzia sp. C1B70]
MPSTDYQPNYTLGRGELWFADFVSGTREPGGYRYIGNTPEFNATVENEELPHYNSDHGIREKDESISLQTDRSATFITDHISPENIALFFLGSSALTTIVAATVDDEEIDGVIPGLSYSLGQTPANPLGAGLLEAYTPGTANIIVTNEAGDTTYVEDTDYKITMTLGFLEVLSGGSIASGSKIKVSYKIASGSQTRIISGSQPIEGSMKFIADNPAGKNRDWLMPWVKLTPNGDFALKGDEWQEIPFSVEILKGANKQAIYITDRVTAS